MRLLITALLGLLLLAPGAVGQNTPAQTPCPCSADGPYPCAAVTVVALLDQADTLGLTAAQRGALLGIQERHLHEIHDILGDIAALQDALHRLDRPFELAEVFALLYDLGQHQAELDAEFRTAEASLLAELDEPQITRWTALVRAAAALQETDIGCEAPAP